MAFFGAEVTGGKTTWINASPETSVQLSNVRAFINLGLFISVLSISSNSQTFRCELSRATQACIFKRARKKDARIVLEICNEGEGSENGEPIKVAVGVLSASGCENIKLDVLVTSKMGLRLAGQDTAGAVVHVVGNEVEPYSESESEMPVEFSTGLAEMLEADSDDDEDDSSDDESDQSEDDADQSKTANGKGAMVVKRKGSALPIITHKTGLQFQDIVVGSGKKVVNGRNVALQYTLRLENGKVVDRADRKRPFKFRLGIGECIKGFDIGVSGMREGGERHLIVPPKLGYGNQPPPGIPRNSTLYFDVIVSKAF